MIILFFNMACNQYRYLLRTLFQVNGISARYINLKSCDFSRGSRHTTSHDKYNSTGTSKTNFPDGKFSRVSEPTVITLDESEVTEVQRVRKIKNAPRMGTAINSPEQLDLDTPILPYYNKLGDADTKFSSMMLLMRSKKERERKGHILLEGQRLIQDAINAGIQPHSIFFSRKESLQALKLPVNSSAEIYKLQYKQMQLWSNLTTSPGIIGVFETPPEQELQSLSGGKIDFPLTLVCDNVREPGNLGAILRVAAGVGCVQVLLTKGCVDLWEPKVLRSGAGAHFRVPVHQGVRWEDLHRLVHLEKASVYLADSTAGVGDGTKPREGVVGAKAGKEEAGKEEEEKPVQVEDDSKGKEEEQSRGVEGLQVQDYAEVDFAGEPGAWVLVLGGETQGLSAEARKLAKLAPSQCRLHIPLAGGVDSLNAAAALAVLMFEMRRQRAASRVIHTLASVAQ